MSMVELRRNSLPHLGVLPLSASPPVWRKTSHPPLAQARPETHSVLLFTPPRSPRFEHFEMTRPKNVSSDVYHRLISESEDLRALVRTITSEAKLIIKAETCSLFLLDRENGDLVATVFDKGNSLSEIRVPMDQGVVGRVATTKTLMNVRDVNRCPFFYACVDAATGFQTRSILCFPVIDNAGTFVGVVELCNKENKTGFSKTDEQRAKTFALYCATSLSHCLLYRKVQEAQRRTHMAGEWVVKDTPKTVDPSEVERLSREPITPWQKIHPAFATFAFSPRTIGENLDYAKAAMSMFADLGFCQLYNIRQDLLANFVLRVANGYRDVYYHNWSHAFAVTHFCWNALKTPKIRCALHEMERLSILIACLCHDIDHRGTNNKFQLERRTPLAQLYSSEGSVLERHHYAQTVTILKDPKCNILQTLTRTQFQCVLNHVRESILATDIAVHMLKLDRLKELCVGFTANGGRGYNDLSSDHHYLLQCLLMTASDLSDQSKDFTNSKAIAENIYREFFSQGDMERAHGTTPMNMMDREKANVCQIQLDFLDTVAVPVFDMLAQIMPEGQATFESIKNNRRCWKTLDEILDRRKQRVLGLDYLHDVELEQEVVEEVRRKREEEAKAAAEEAKKKAEEEEARRVLESAETPSTSSSSFSSSSAEPQQTNGMR